MRIRFGDATSLRIGSESLVSLDEFIYAPFKRSKMTLTLSKGVFRFVTGKMSKRAYKIITPTATIGVRGTDFLATVTDTITLISPLKKASLTGFHATAKHIAAKAVSPSSETMRTI